MRLTLTIICCWVAALGIAINVYGEQEHLRSGLEMEQGNDDVLDVEKPTPRPKFKACWKEGESRGAGVLPDRKSKTCPSSHPDKSMGLCYPTCKNVNRDGVGPLCWDNCAKTVYHSNGVVFCCENDDTCSQVSFTVE